MIVCIGCGGRISPVASYGTASGTSGSLSSEPCVILGLMEDMRDDHQVIGDFV